MKTCSKCKESKPLSEFYKCGAGLRCWCKDCVKQYYRQHREVANACSRRYRQGHPQVYRAASRRFRAAHPEECRARIENWYRNNPGAEQAHQVLNKAVQAGKVQKPDHCAICGVSLPARLLQGHHASYDKSLNVLWCCGRCHKEIHRGALEGAERERRAPC